MYTKELIQEAIEVYPNESRLHDLLNSGNAFAGRILDDMSHGSIPLDDILIALTLQELQDKARILKRRVRLYQEWCKQDPRKQC